MKRFLLALLSLTVISIASPVFAGVYSYSEDFTDPGFDPSTWTQVFDGTWADTSGGPFYGIASGTSPVAATFYDLMPNLDSTGISAQAVFTTSGVDSSAGIFIGATPNQMPAQMPDDYDAITVGVRQDSNTGNMYFYIDDNGNFAAVELTDANANMTFSLSVQIDASNNLFWQVDGYGDGSISQNGNTSLVSMLTGLAGIFSEAGGANFEEFSVSGNAVPVPGALLLLGSGLVALTGLRRKQ